MSDSAGERRVTILAPSIGDARLRVEAMFPGAGKKAVLSRMSAPLDDGGKIDARADWRFVWKVAA